MDELRRLYVDEQLTLRVIARRYGCSVTTVWRRLQAMGIVCREGGLGPRYVRGDFSGDVCERAYLVGFRIGDLHVAQEGHTIVVKCTSTREEQVELFHLLFDRYGHVYTDERTMARRQRQTVGMSVALNLSFQFLLPKQDAVPEWVLQRDDTFFAFLAGYLDAEGYIRNYMRPGFANPQCQLEVRSYDGVLLGELGEGLNSRGIICPAARVRVRAGYVNRAGVRSNGDLWGLGVCRRDALLALFARIDPYLRHGRRRRDMLQTWSVLLANYH